MQGVSSGSAPPPEEQHEGGGGGTHLVSAAAADPPSPPRPPISAAMEFFEHHSQSIVTVEWIGADSVPKFGTGFILLSEPRYTVVLASQMLYAKGLPQQRKYSVIFHDKSKKTAYRLCPKKHQFILLLVKEEKQRKAITFCKEPLNKHKFTITIAVMSGTKIHPDAEAPIRELLGTLGYYKGFVVAPNCKAFDASTRAKLERGSERFFGVMCRFQDDLVTLKDIDNKEHTSDTVLAAPVLLWNGECVGVISSPGSWMDIKIGLHSTSVISSIGRLIGFDNAKMKKMNWEAEWKELLKKKINDEELN